ncbi:hypothetical protein F8C76_02555 [Flagellimonas olearia]|uniref:Uncharacterized protein n=1 Tax=Flagellimonas olearia TaxID=552546 RepID=A0A6I1DYN3_9FLAO|nr:hypothetical protein [Allomuricauda olearia]KAB7530408.1 hypothetical protein F8C76_02555 [Allomuricauda olearia]
MGNYARWIPEQTPLDPHNPMKKFEVFLGEWDCVEKSYFPGNIQESFKARAHIYFLQDQKTLCVDEIGVDSTFRFLGFHKYDPDLEVYLNYGATYQYPMGGYALETYDSDKNEFRFNLNLRLYPDSNSIKNNSPITVEGSNSKWIVQDVDHHKFYAWTLGEEGREIPLKEVLYSRIK